MLIEKTLLIMIILSATVFSQSHRITKVIETNLFELDSGQKVKFYGIFIPAQKDSNLAMAKIAGNILQWENEYLLNKTFEFYFIKNVNKGISESNIYKIDTSERINMANQLLERGYAIIKPDIDRSYGSQLLGSQKKAEQLGVGMWEYSAVPPNNSK